MCTPLLISTDGASIFKFVIVTGAFLYISLFVLGGSRGRANRCIIARSPVELRCGSVMCATCRMSVCVASLSVLLRGGW